MKGGGGGAQFLLGFDLPTENDQIYVIDKIKVIIRKKKAKIKDYCYKQLAKKFLEYYITLIK